MEREDRFYLETAYKLANLSPDPSTQNGAVVYRPEWMTPRSIPGGYNYPASPPEGYDPEDRDAKLACTIHAEEAAIIAAARAGVRTSGATMAGTWVACPSCARRIVASGIVRVVTCARTYRATPDRWKAQVDLGLGILRREGVEVVHLEDVFAGDPIRFNRWIWH